MKKLFVIALSAAMALSLVACGAKAENNVEENKQSTTSEQIVDTTTDDTKVDTVSTPSVYTNKYTNLDKEALLAEISKYSGVTVVATANADGTPNIAILTPGVAGEYIVFNTAPNTTQENIRRDKKAEMIFDIVNTTAETKEERHKGATLKLELMEDATVIEELKKESQFISDISMVCKIVEVMPVG